MSNVFTLDSMREETEKKFAPVKIGLSDGSEVELSSMLRKKKPEREAVVAAVEDVNNNDVDEDDPTSIELITEAIAKILTIIADRPAELLADLEHEDPMIKVNLMTDVLYLWAKETQLGEASSSPN